jgi:hypothetical protein
MDGVTIQVRDLKDLLDVLLHIVTFLLNRIVELFQFDIGLNEGVNRMAAWSIGLSFGDALKQSHQG